MTPLQPASPAAALASSGSATSPLPPDGAWGQPSPTAGRPAPVATPAEVDAPNGLVVEMRDVSKNFGRVPALSNLTILVPDGRITVLLGPNGAG
ncbi:MAG: hypothetical protein ACXWA3_16535, partial [Acidimicrobiales bacterium]